MAEFILSDFDNLYRPWQQIYERSSYKLLFSSPGWTRLWWDHFGGDSRLYLGAVTVDGKPIGIAPLRIKDGTLYFIGSDDVCDFLDFIVIEGQEKTFFEALVNHVHAAGLNFIHLSTLLPDSATLRWLPDILHSRGMTAETRQIDVTVAMTLSHDVASYLSALKGKQRHEILRKERRLNEEGEIKYSVNHAADNIILDTFLRFFRDSREDKNMFLTSKIETFFRDMVSMAGKQEMLRLGLLELNSVPVAATLCFDYRNDIYLYNSGYNPDYRWLSVGLLSKYFCIKNSIERGKSRYDFLKGNEKYKFYLGGKETPLYEYQINVKPD